MSDTVAPMATLDSAPAAGQKVIHEDKTYTTVKEGLAYILVPDAASTKKEKGKKAQAVNDAGPVQQVFYNPIQQFNRDLTVLAMTAYGEEVIEKKRIVQAKQFKQRVEKKRKAEEKKKRLAAAAAVEAEGDGENKRKRDQEDGGDSEASNKAARPDEATSPQGSRAHAEAIEGQNTSQSTAPAEDQDTGAKNDLPRPRFAILDALSASGLRALRFAHEIPFATTITANDLDPSAVEAIARNVRHNGLQGRIEVTQGNAVGHMYNKIAANMGISQEDRDQGKTYKYDVVDLDPYGTAACFFDAAVQAVREDGGLLCVTCTDAGVWASNGYAEKAFALYGGIPIKGWHSHEAGLRLILNGIATTASRYGLTIEPLLSLSIDFYARIFVKVTKSAAAVKFAAGKTMMVYNCDAGCGSWTTQYLLRNKASPNKTGSGSFYKHQMSHGPTADQTCEHCGTKTHLAGPMYGGRLHNPDFIKRILDKLPNADTSVYGTTARIKGMLTTALEEHMEVADPSLRPQTREDKYAELEPYPFYVSMTQLASTLRSATPSEVVIRSALQGLGYRVTRSHCKPGSIKTDAPFSVLWRIMREWIRKKSPIKVENIKPGSAGWRILQLDQAKPAAAGEEAAEAFEKDNDTGDVSATEEVAGGGGKQKVKEAEEDEIVFDEKLGREKNKEKLVRYQMNPRENWGPMNRARG
ncbi:S-adenosyl-L-methionine-dependent methyltransferase [Coniella lustricola]|uniref:tRNA (guanine(26)-N(2))-dimethyltransferase n=1 Tax=Coniella lustricola TaxID=2025994 RepID=A0A2T3AKJ3_9PEZI|nr:S-adenosyl-L-methionine-dependent methyltransferase [Coniella lustricola]